MLLMCSLLPAWLFFSTLGLRDGCPQPNSEELLGMAKRLIQVHAETMIINK